MFILMKINYLMEREILNRDDCEVFIIIYLIFQNKKNEGNIFKIQPKVKDKNVNLKIFVKVLYPKLYPPFMFG